MRRLLLSLGIAWSLLVGGVYALAQAPAIQTVVILPGGVPTSPPSTALWGWWAASNNGLSEAYTETSGTPATRITSDGTSIGSMRDLSSNGRNLYQTAAGQKPVYKTNILNSLPGARYDVAALSIMTCLNSSGVVQAPTGNSFSFYIVLNRTTSTNLASVVANNDGGINPRYSIIDDGSGNLRNFNGGYGTAVAMSSTAYHLVASSFDNTGSFPTVLKIDNGTSQSDNVTGNGNLGTQFQAGYLLFAWTGDIVEILAYTAVHSFTSGDGLIARQYLNGKYKIVPGL